MRLQELKDVASRQADEHELVDLLELTVDDILDRFADRLLEFKERFGVVDPDD
jgi:hypothetical protein